MLTGLSTYISELKTKVDENIFSPLFVRLANLYYHDGQFEECISVCTTGLKVYNNYFTAKILLLKALLKLGYFGEADNILREVEEKFSNMEVIKNFRNEMDTVRKSNQQERIYYSNKINTPLDFHTYSGQLNGIMKTEEDSEKDIDIILLHYQENETSALINKIDFEKFLVDFENIKLSSSKHVKIKPEKDNFEDNKLPLPTSVHNSFSSKIKIITETLADILAKQGYFKEAFEAYNLLLKSDFSNKRRIQEKLYELERNFS